MYFLNNASICFLTHLYMHPSKCLLVCVSVIAGVLNEIAGRPSAHQPASVFAASVPHNPPRH